MAVLNTFRLRSELFAVPADSHPPSPFWQVYHVHRSPLSCGMDDRCQNGLCGWLSADRANNSDWDDHLKTKNDDRSENNWFIVFKKVPFKMYGDDWGLGMIFSHNHNWNQHSISTSKSKRSCCFYFCFTNNVKCMSSDLLCVVWPINYVFYVAIKKTKKLTVKVCLQNTLQRTNV